MQLRGLILSIVLLLGAFISLAIYKNGETVNVVEGRIQSCQQLSGGKENLTHARIKTNNNSYVVTAFDYCSPGKKVNVYTKRGALYFNTVFFAKDIDAD